jgi:hypothetical protein
LHRQGGYGWQMGDEGSAARFARMALLAVGRANDGVVTRQRLPDLSLAHAPPKRFDEPVRWSAAAEPGEIAALASLVLAAAARGDAVARGSSSRPQPSSPSWWLRSSRCSEAGGADQARTRRRKPGPGARLRAPVLARLHKLHRLAVREAPLDPVEGALALARENV